MKPETFVKWHRTAFKMFWRWRSRKRGRPALPKNICELVRQMARENPTWGEERIANELSLKLGIRVSPRTVGKYLEGTEIGAVKFCARPNLSSQKSRAKRTERHKTNSQLLGRSKHSALLWIASYGTENKSEWSGRGDSNARPPAPKASKRAIYETS